MTRNNADFHGVTFYYAEDADGDHNIIAEHPSQEDRIGTLTWANRDYEEGAQEGHIMDVEVDPKFRRKGVATGMYREAERVARTKGLPMPKHAESRTQAGNAWSKTVGNYYPPSEMLD